MRKNLCLAIAIPIGVAVTGTLVALSLLFRVDSRASRGKTYSTRTGAPS